MTRWTYPLAVVGVLSLASALAAAQELMIYPAKGQGAEQQEKDKFQCYGFAKGQSGFDPMAPPTATAPPPQQEAQQGGAGRGLARGAIGGAAIGAIGGDTRKGAAMGAVGGGLIGGMRRQDQKSREQQKQQQWEQQQVQQYSANRNNYNRAYAACLEGRGYTVR